MAPMGEIEILADTAALADRVAAWLHDRVMQAGEAPSICLSGGEMPRLVY